MSQNPAKAPTSTQELSSAQLRALLAQLEAREAAQRAAVASAPMDVDVEGDNVDIEGDEGNGKSEVAVPKMRKSKAKGKEKESEGESKTRRSTRRTGQEVEATSSRVNIPLVRKPVPYVEINSDANPQLGLYVYPQKCSGCQSRDVVCWAQYAGKACTTCANANRRCDHSSMGPAAAKKKKDSASAAPPTPTTNPNVYSPMTARQVDFTQPHILGPAPTISTAPLNVGPPVAPRRALWQPLVQPSSPSPAPVSPPMEMIRSPRLSPAHQCTRLSPGQNVEVLLMSVDGVTQEIREWCISTDRNTEALEENTRELRGQRGDMREMMDMMRSNSDAVRENTSELRRTRMEQERRMDYGDRSKGSFYGGSQGSYGSQGGWGM